MLDRDCRALTILPSALLLSVILGLAIPAPGGAANQDQSRVISCPDEPSELVLTQIQQIPLESDIPPRALRWLAGQPWWVDASTGRIMHMSDTGMTTSTEVDGQFVTLGVGYRRLLGVADNKIRAYSLEGRFLTEVDIRIQRTITSILGDQDGIWLALADSNGASVIRVMREEKTQVHRLRKVFDLDGPVRLRRSIYDGVIAAMIAFPYRLTVFDSIGKVVRRMTPGKIFNLDSSFRPQDSVFSLAALPLGCGRILQFLADLRSDRRWIVLYGQGGAVLRTSAFQQPIGIIQSLYPNRPILVGFRDSPERGEVVLYRWRWESSTDTQTGGTS